MQLTTNRDELGKVLGTLLRIVNPSALLESLRGVRLEVTGGVLSIHATNLEIGVRVQLACTDTQDGAMLINPRTLLDSIKYSSASTVTLAQNDTNLTITLSSGTTTIKSLNDTDFPVIPITDTDLPITLKTNGFISGVRSVLYAVSKSVIKPELASVYLWQDGGELVFVATDSFRLAEKRVAQTLGDDTDATLLIPQKNVQDLVGILEQLEVDTLYAGIEKDQLTLGTDSMRIVVRTLDSAFPDYQKILPKDPTTEATLLKKDLSQILKKTGTFSDKFNKILITATQENSGITIRTANQDVGEMNDTVQAVIEGEDTQVSINHQYLSDCLQSIESDSVVLSFYGVGKPIIVRGVGDKSFTYLVMPMNR